MTQITLDNWIKKPINKKYIDVFDQVLKTKSRIDSFLIWLECYDFVFSWDHERDKVTGDWKNPYVIFEEGGKFYCSHLYDETTKIEIDKKWIWDNRVDLNPPIRSKLHEAAHRRLADFW